MELLDGLDLETLVSRFGPQPPARVVHLLEQVCHSLGEAHDAGLIHRDVKPANLFLCRLGRDVDVIKVLDFGLVGVARGLVSAAGTPGYVAPEAQAGAEIDARADLWALGRVALFMLAGDPAARPETVEPPALGRLIARCLEPSPADRPRHVDEIAAALAAIELDDPWTPARARRWWRENQPELSAAADAAETATAASD
jgi:serine/threonine-protein kinase